ARVRGLGCVPLRQPDDVAGLRGVLRPHAGVTVGLQLSANRAALRSLLPRASCQVAEQVLDLVAVLVCEDVGLCEGTAAGPEAALELVEEAEVDVDVLVGRTGERGGVRARAYA